ncbi:MAG TPA: hypothetical protein VFR24_10215 [Candidatus Angelobacter sp.]|nr:hypothetical protein [Candidatus Angelobacter sp.]
MKTKLKKGWILYTLCTAAFLHLTVRGWARVDDDTCSNPTSQVEHSGSLPTQFKDNPAARSNWFLNGRKTSTQGLAEANQVPPARRLLQSVQQLNQMPRRPGLAAAPPAWRPLGPAPQSTRYWGDVSGRVTSLAADRRNGAKALYAGTAFGGLWKTDDVTAAQPHFVPLGDTLWPSLAVGSIALDTSQPAGQPPIIYVGTGEANDSLDSYYGIGILKSSDGGNTWSLSTGAGTPVQLPSPVLNLDGPFVGAAISKIVVDPEKPKHVLAAVSSSFLGATKSPVTAIFESPDGGDSWKATTLENGTTSYNCSDLIYEPVQKVFYAAIQGRGVFRLGPGGTSWKATASPFNGTTVDAGNFSRASLAVRTSGSQSTIYMIISAGDFGENDPRTFNLSRPTPNDTGVVQTNDGGASWSPVQAPDQVFGGQGFYDQWIVAPAGNQTLLAGGIDIWRADFASGPAWMNVSRAYEYGDAVLHPNRHIHPDQHAIVFLDDRNWIVGNDGGIWRTSDAGNTWIDLNTDISSIQFMSVTPLRSPGEGYLGGSQDNGTVLTGNVAGQWATTLTGDGGFTADNPSLPKQYFTERFWVSLCRSDDSGTTWKTVVDTNTISEPQPFYVPYKLLRTQATEVLLGTQRIWLGPAVPASPGAGWRSISPLLTRNGFVQSIASAPHSPQTVYVTTSEGQVFVSPNVHAPDPQWSTIKRGLPDGRPYAAVAVDPRSAKVVYLAVQGFRSGHLFRTDNGGGSWLDVTPKFHMGGQAVQIDTPANSILIDPDFPSDVYLATDIGVFVSSDKGATWQPYSVGLPRTAVLELKMNAGRKIVAATHGRGAWTIEALSHAVSRR